MNGLMSIGVAAFLLLGRDGGPEVVRLKVGTEVVIEVVEFDEARGVKARRVDDGALLDLAFDQMAPEDARRLRAARGYLPDEPEAVLVEAMQVKLVGGQTYTGIIVEQGTDTFRLRQRNQIWDFRRNGVLSIAPVQVDALEVYDGEELYARELALRNPQTALDHYNLALYCESLQVWTRAIEHLKLVAERDPAFKADIVDGKAKRAALRLESNEDSAELSKAQRLAQHERYDAALTLIDGFLAKKQGSGLRAEFEKARKGIARQREKWLRQEVITHFFVYLERAARQIASEPGIGLKQARQRMQLEGSNLAVEATAKQLNVKPAEVLAQWQDPKRLTGSQHYATYGSGTFTLGSIEAIQKGLVAEEDPAAKKSDPNAGDDSDSGTDYLDRIKKILEEKRKQQEEAGRNKGPKKPEKRGPEIADVPPTDDEWWTAANTNEKTQYVMAWWADHDDSVKKLRAEARECAQCVGTGMIRYFDTSGANKFVPCSRCKSLGIDRCVRFH